MSQKIVLTLIIVAFILSRGNAWALTDSEILALIDQYRTALADGNNEQIEGSWLALHGQPEAVAYVKQTLPNLFASYQLEGLAIEWKRINTRWSSDQQQRDQELKAALAKLETEAQKVFRAAPASNLQEVLQYPNLVTSRTANNAVLDPNKVTTATDNRILALQFPNQLRSPNQDIIRGKIETLLGPRSKEYGVNPSFTLNDNNKTFENR